MWLFIPAVQGESTDFAHKNWIDLQSWSWGAPNASLLGTTTGGVVNKGDGSGPTVSNLVITKSIDKATPLLMLACCAGAHYKTVLLAVRKAGGTQDYLHITLTDVFLTSFNVGMTGGGTGEENPTESVTLNFTKVEFAYAPPTGGVIDTFWNLGTAQGPAGTVP
jgi:type VI secretion system secreted protein Hcp